MRKFKIHWGWVTFLVVVAMIGIGFANKNTDGSYGPSPKDVATPTPANQATGANWYPNGYTIDPTLNSDVAYEILSAAQVKGQPCTWCSATHGNDYWKVNFIAKDGCSNLFINTEIDNPSGQAIGTWYQKGGSVGTLQPEELEIVSHNSTDTFKFTEISCT